MRGKLYSVGIGPGDPEYMTLKAVRLLKECDVVAIPEGDNGQELSAILNCRKMLFISAEMFKREGIK